MFVSLNDIHCLSNVRTFLDSGQLVGAELSFYQPLTNTIYLLIIHCGYKEGYGHTFFQAGCNTRECSVDETMEALKAVGSLRVLHNL